MQEVDSIFNLEQAVVANWVIYSHRTPDVSKDWWVLFGLSQTQVWYY
jgi:hypothetical protein